MNPVDILGYTFLFIFLLSAARVVWCLTKHTHKWKFIDTRKWVYTYHNGVKSESMYRLYECEDCKKIKKEYL